MRYETNELDEVIEPLGKQKKTKKETHSKKESEKPRAKVSRVKESEEDAKKPPKEDPEAGKKQEEREEKTPPAFKSFRVANASYHSEEEPEASFVFEEEEKEKKKKGPIRYTEKEDGKTMKQNISHVLYSIDAKSMVIKAAVIAVIVSCIMIMLLQGIWCGSVPDPSVQNPTRFLPLAIIRTFRYAPAVGLLSAIIGLMTGGCLVWVQRTQVKLNMGSAELELSGNITYGQARFASDREMEGKARVPGTDDDFIKQAVQFDPTPRPTGLVVGYNRKIDKVVVDHANNRNVAVYGASGTGKTFTYVKPNILMCIDNGFSFVTSDPSGELFRDTSRLAAKQGFTVRVLNIKHIFASNAWDFLMPIKQAAKSTDPSKAGTAETLADQLVTVVMENSSDDKHGDNYFQQIASNLFLFLIRYVAMSPNFLGREEERTIGTCYDILVQLQGTGGDYPEFDELPPGDPAYAAWKTFKGLSDNQKSSAMSGLEGALHVFNNDTVKEAFAHDEIDLSLPGKKPCAYYLVTSVSDTTFRFIQSLFFSMIFQELIEEGEQRPDNRLIVPVYFILDEFKAIGRIKDFEAKIANVRKYGISISIIFQDPSQMESSYGDDAASILANCAINVILGVNDIKSAKSISERVGIATVRNHSTSSPRSVYSPFSSFVTSENYASADGKRNLLTPDEIMELSGEGKTLIIAQGMKPYIAKPYPFLYHWLAKYMTDDLKQIESEFVPPWQHEEKLMTKSRTFLGAVKGTDEARKTQGNDTVGSYRNDSCGYSGSKTVVRDGVNTHATPEDDEDETGNRFDIEYHPREKRR